jgi:hypothetical protein
MRFWLSSASIVFNLLVIAATTQAREPSVGRDPGAIRGPAAGWSSFPTPAFDGSGRLWLAFVEQDFVYVTHSDDLGKSFAHAVAVNREPEKIDANGEGRPKIAFTQQGSLLVTWTKKLDEPYTGLIRFSRSTDGGKSFSAPTTINDDGIITGHRFDALAVAPSGDVLIAWIDKRDLESALAEGAPYDGAAIYVALSRDDGKSFEPNRKLKDHVCECCRLSFAFDSSGEPALLFRDLTDTGIRDHTLARGVDAPESARIHRVTVDDWKINACPHHGPSYWIDGRDVHHITWFTAGERSGTGVFYARSTDGGDTFSEPMQVGGGERAAHPFVLGAGRDTFLVWKVADGKASRVFVMASDDGGESWSAASLAAEGASGADHPLLVSNGRDVFLSWFTKDAGYHLIALDVPSSSE